MYPILFHYKIITIGTYGIMLGLAFYLGFLLLERELKQKGKDPELAYKLLLGVIPSAIVGAKIAHILDNLQQFKQDPSGMIFSGAGLSVYGGLILTLIVAVIIIKKNNEDILGVLDAGAPSMALGYGIGRIGCHVSGDGCYGIVTKTFLGVSYPNGIVPTSAFVFPTPLFESAFSILVFVFLMKFRKREYTTGTLIFTFLMLNGIARFLVEFIRLNPKVIAGLTQAQIIAVFLVITGAIGLFMINRKAKMGSAA